MASRKPKVAETTSLPEKEILDTAADKAAEQTAPALPETDQTADAVQTPSSDVEEGTPAPAADEAEGRPVSCSCPIGWPTAPVSTFAPLPIRMESFFRSCLPVPRYWLRPSPGSPTALPYGSP